MESKKYLTILVLIANLVFCSSMIAQTANEKRETAVKETNEAMQLFNLQTVESVNAAKEKLIVALKLTREVGDKNLEAVVLFALGRVYFTLGDDQRSLENYEQSLKLFRLLKDRESEAITLTKIAYIYREAANKPKAVEYFRLAIDIYRTLGNQSLVGQFEKEIAELDTGKAANNGQKPLDERFAKALQSLEEARILSQQGTQRSIQSAIEKSLYARNLFAELGDKKWEATALLGIGYNYFLLGESTKSLGYYEQSLKLRREISDKEGEAVVLNNIGIAFDKLGDKRKAIEFYNEALVTFVAVGDKFGQGLILNNIGAAYESLGEKEKALDYLTRALPLRRAAEDKNGVVETLNNLGTFYLEQSNWELSLKYYDEALILVKDLSSQRIEGQILHNVGVVYLNLGESKKAFDFLTRSLELRKNAGDKEGQAETLLGFGGLNTTFGDLFKAKDFYFEAFKLYQATGNADGMANSLFFLGSLLGNSSEIKDALEILNQSLKLMRSTENRRGQIYVLNNVGSIYQNSGEYNKAIEIYGQVLILARELGDKGGEILALNNSGYAYFQLGNKKQALENLTLSLVLSKAYGFKNIETTTLTTLAFIFRRETPKYAAFLGKLAVVSLQDFRQSGKGLDNEIQKGILRTFENRYRYLAEILIEQDRLAEATETLNAFKDQQFFDFNRENIANNNSITMTEREREFAGRYRNTAEKLGEIASMLDKIILRTIGRQATAEESAQIKKIEEDFKKVAGEFSVVLEQATKDFSKPSDEKDKIGAIDDVTAMQNVLRDVSAKTGQKTVAVYQLIGEEKYSAVIITADAVKKVSTSVKNKELNEKARRYWAILQTDAYDTRKLGKQLYEIVFEPLEKELPKDTKTILWSMDGNLRYVPMATLFDGEKYLVERFQHVVFTRADTERLTRNVSKVWTGTGFGSTRQTTVELLGESLEFNALPGVTAELREIFKTAENKQAIITGEVLSDKNFSRKNMLAALSQKRPLVHIASHFSFRPGDESRSFLLLGDGTAFSLADIKREKDLFSGVELLTLSACNTAAQQSDATGREIDGFAELAQRLGAGAVMATLWQVSDASTPWLMRDFYQNRQAANGISKAEALQKAQIALLNGTAKTESLPAGTKGESQNIEIIRIPKGGKRDNKRAEVFYVEAEDAPDFKKDQNKPFAHPYYWSPFVIYGNWK